MNKEFFEALSKVEVGDIVILDNYPNSAYATAGEHVVERIRNWDNIFEHHLWIQVDPFYPQALKPYDTLTGMAEEGNKILGTIVGIKKKSGEVFTKERSDKENVK
jgi:hypothetical protein